ncbi:neurochondrin-like isoform X1 [Xyrauchen texanus]|uniref:neurochondrin-like isoform X1 n=2 Tax=Xyrauchen texanus TaxID=154827 RepID=UPI0022418EAA|nr:neurochondrin-like isoform X1 [Xyrauchen texanus]
MPVYRLALKMAEDGSYLNPEEISSQHNLPNMDQNGADGFSSAPGSCGLSASQSEVLERCLHTLAHAKNDSHTLAALLLITRLCPAGQLDNVTLHRIFEAVGLNLPARLLVTAFRGSDSSGLPPEELISLGTALLAALSTDSQMAAHPQLLSTIPLILNILENGPNWTDTQPQTLGEESEKDSPSQTMHTNDGGLTATIPQTNQSSSLDKEACTDSSKTSNADGPDQACTSRLDEALAHDCYQVLNAVCGLPQGKEQLLTRSVVPALCRAILKKQTLSFEKGLPLLGHLLSSNIRERAWTRHSSDLLSLLGSVSQNFSRASDHDKLAMCSQIPQFLPPPGAESENQEIMEIVANLWAPLRPLVQSKLSKEQLGPVLVLSACLLDLHGWDSVGSPKFCCLLVNRACVEVRMGLEEPPGTELSPQLQHTLTACYRIMEAAMEQACSQGVVPNPAQLQTAITGLSLKQSRQILGVLEEAFSAVIYYLKQADQSHHDDPFLFATFRSLCAWLAEETSCLKEDVIGLLPFLIGYAKYHFMGGRIGKGLADWMSNMSINNSSQDGTWPSEAALRYLLPALCHLSAEDGPRNVLLSLDTPSLLVDFLSKGWGSTKGQSQKKGTGDPSMETTCSALLNFVITEPERVRSDPCFVALETMLSEALPVLIHKPRLLVLAANYCTLGLMIGRLKPASSDPVEPGQRRFFSSALSFLLSAMQAGQASNPARISALWEEHWEEAGELWRLSLQALGGCVRAQPWITSLIREEVWLQSIFTLLGSSGKLPDQQSQDALEEVLCAIAKQSPVCRHDISVLLKTAGCGSLQCMPQLSRILVD